jgi:iron(III) transport system substrate-binding protein
MREIEAAARKEARLVVYASAGHILPPDQQAISEVMAQKYGITVEWTPVGGARDYAPRILAEHRTKRPAADIVMGGPTSTIEEFAPRGIVQAILAPSTLQEGVWRLNPARDRPQQRDWLFLFFSLTPSFIINTDMVRPGEEPKSYQDLLNRKWKGKITVESPGHGGSGVGWFRATYRTLGLDYMRKLAGQVALARVGAEVPDSVARGQYAIGISPTVARSREVIRQGAQVRFVMAREGGLITEQGMSLLSNAPHPNAAKVFIEWFYTKEGQTIYSQSHSSISIRRDVPHDYLPPHERYMEGTPFFIQAAEDLEPGRPQATLLLGRQIFEEGK